MTGTAPPEGDRETGRKSGNDAPAPDARAIRDAKDYKAALGDAHADLEQLWQTENRPERREQIGRIIERIDAQTADVDEMVQAGTGQPPGGAFKAVAGQKVLVDDVENAAEAEADSGRQRFWDRIKFWLDRAGVKLWALISRLVTVKEWSLAGTVGTGVLGLGQVSISVTFG